MASHAHTDDSIQYGTGEWSDNYGNHRAVIEVKDKAGAVRVHIPWRRRDPDPETKAVWVMPAAKAPAITRSVYKPARINTSRLATFFRRNE